MKAHHTWLMALAFLCLAAACSSDPVSDSDALWSPEDLEDRGDLITEIPAERSRFGPLDLGLFRVNEAQNIVSYGEMTLLVGDDFYGALKAANTQGQTFIFLGDDASSPQLHCGRGYTLELSSLTTSDPRLLKIEQDEQGFTLRTKAPGLVTIHGVGLLVPNHDASNIAAKHELCDAMFGPAHEQPAPWRGEIKVHVVQPAGVKPLFEPWAPYPQWGYDRNPDCAVGPRRQVQLVEGGFAHLRYVLMDHDGEEISSDNWGRAEPFILRQRQEHPRLNFFQNESARLIFESVEGTGRAYLESAWGQFWLIEVLGKEHVADIDVIFLTLWPERRLEDLRNIPIDKGPVIVNFGAVTLRNGAQACGSVRDHESKSLTPTVCTVEPDHPNLRRSTLNYGYAVNFLKPGRCEFELSWPGTTVRKRYTLNGVEAK